MANETPESEFSIECFQNYSAGEVFVQGLAGVVDQNDVESLIRSQKTIVDPDLGPACSTCARQLSEPYIECCQCDATVCTSCYSSGRETILHSSDHSYRVRKNDFPIFDNCNWTAKEELKLLKALSMFGYGNWEQISKYIQTRSELECEEHYKKYYIENVQHKELELLPHTTQSMFPQPLIPFLETERPYSLRCPLYCERTLASFNTFRSEFGLNYDNNAEKLLDCIGDVNYDDELMAELTVAVGNALNNKLKERKRRYDIIKRHGLIQPHKVLAWSQRFYETLGRNYIEKMFPFMQLLTGMQFDVLIERLNFEEELSVKLAHLYEYRRLGIRTNRGAEIYKKFRKSDQHHIKEIKDISQLLESNVHKPLSLRKFKKYSPKALDIADLPGYHLLSDKEKSLCSRLRFLPQKYLEIRDKLVTENDTFGSLRLLDARRIARIDVNKTKKIYDYLVEEGFVKKP